MTQCIGWKPKSSDRNVASVRYRCLLPLESLKKKGVNIELFQEKFLSKYDVVLFSKLYDHKNQIIAQELRRKGTKTILDLCDNHFYNPFDLPAYTTAKTNMLQMLDIVDEVVCSTDALAEIIMHEANLDKLPTVIGDPIESLPSIKEKAVKQEAWVKKIFSVKNTHNSLPILLWYGSHGSPNAPSGMSDILSIEKILNKIYVDHPFELVVASNNKKKYVDLIEPMSIPTRYVEWEHSNFKNVLKSANGVIIPITVNPFTICKTNNRLIIALSHGVPVVADSIRSYEEFRPYCYLDDWEIGLRNIIENHKSVQKITSQGCKYINANWTVEKLTSDWGNLLSCNL